MKIDIFVKPPNFQIKLCDLDADCFLQNKNKFVLEKLKKVSTRTIPKIKEFFY